MSSSPNPKTFIISHVSCWDKTKVKPDDDDKDKKYSQGISTGIGFLDHMIDQFNSHAQIGISIIVESCGGQENGNDKASNGKDEKNRHASSDQAMLLDQVGTAIGERLKTLLPNPEKERRVSRFCCPLDEALVECILEGCDDTNHTSPETKFQYNLAPYGIYPKSTGRTRIGQLQTQPLEIFWKALSTSLSCSLSKISLKKIRGHNGHHIVESSFKAFCRALRCYIDGTSSEATEQTWGKSSLSYKQGIELKRMGSVQRSTKETSIDVTMKLDGSSTGIQISTGLPMLDNLFTAIASECNDSMSLTVSCDGDLYVDDHHTSEDVSIAIGQVLNKSLGSKGGLNRMWTSRGQEGDAIVDCIMDLSNRPCFVHDLDLSHHGEEVVHLHDDNEGVSIEMIEHVFDSLVMNSHMTAHFVQVSVGKNTKDLVIAACRAFGRALGKCIAVDPRRAGATASSKGTLSV